MRNVLILLTTLVVLYGCGSEKKEDGDTAKNVGKNVGKSLSKFVSGVGEGIDKEMLVEVTLGEALKAKGISKTVAKSLGPKKGISVYLISKTATKGTLMAKAMNQEGLEIGRVSVEIDFADDDAKYVKFPFEKEMDLQLVKNFIIDIKPKKKAKK